MKQEFKATKDFTGDVCSALVVELSKHEHKMYLNHNTYTVDPKSILGLMSLGIKKGETFELEIKDCECGSVFKKIEGLV